MEKIGFQLARRIMPLFEQIPYHNQLLYDIPAVTICIYICHVSIYFPVYIYTYIIYKKYIIYTYVCVAHGSLACTRYVYIYICVCSYSKPKKDINCRAWSAMIISEP